VDWLTRPAEPAGLGGSRIAKSAPGWQRWPVTLRAAARHRFTFGAIILAGVAFLGVRCDPREGTLPPAQAPAIGDLEARAYAESVAADGPGAAASPGAPAGPGARMEIGDGRSYPILALGALSPAAERFLASRDPHWAMAVVLPGRSVAYAINGHEPFALASLTKVLIMLAVLDRAEAEEREPTVHELALMAAMIEFSDNESAAILWEMVGGRDQIAGFLERAGVPGIVPAPVGAGWGDTTATAQGLAHLLAKVVTGTILSDASRAIATGLMAQVAEEQRWGVSTAFPATETPVSIKDGWYPALTGWRVTSAGFSSDEAIESLVIVTLTRNQASFEYAVETIQGAASLVGNAIYGESVQPVDPGEPLELPPTEVLRFVPSAEGLGTLAGACEAPSEVAHREGAWRCNVEDASFDPCFAPEPPSQTAVVCGARPDGGGEPFLLETGGPLPARFDEDLRYPWLLLLDDETECQRAVGADIDEDGDSVSYLCVDGTTLIGPLHRTGAWAALRFDPLTWHTWTSRVSFAWY
jgi:Beta-lactamase enzyme family